MARGVGSLVGTRTVRITSVDGKSTDVTANLAVVLGVGSIPILPPIPGLKDAQVWTARDATSAEIIPRHLIVMGAGAVGTEMATAYASFGSKVTLVSRASEILPSVDARAGSIVREAMQSRGIDVRVGTAIVRVQRHAPDVITAELSTGESITGSAMLVATGRRSEHERLNLEAVSNSATGKWIAVDESLGVKTNDGEAWLYAAGDMTGRSLLTHTSKYHGRIVSNAILARRDGKTLSGQAYSPEAATADNTAVPQVIFSDPPVACAGLNSMTAGKNGYKVRETTAPFVSLGGHIASDAAINGWAQWLVDTNDRLVGATFVGFGAADQLHASTVAVVGGLSLDRLAHAIPSFPTISEVYLNLLDAAGL